MADQLPAHGGIRPVGEGRTLEGRTRWNLALGRHRQPGPQRTGFLSRNRFRRASDRNLLTRGFSGRRLGVHRETCGRELRRGSEGEISLELLADRCGFRSRRSGLCVGLGERLGTNPTRSDLPDHPDPNTDGRRGHPRGTSPPTPVRGVCRTTRCGGRRIASPCRPPDPAGVPMGTGPTRHLRP